MTIVDNNHSNYTDNLILNFSFPQNDIALLELSEPLTFGPDVAAICSPDPDNTYAGDVAIVAGWGRLSYGGSKLSRHCLEHYCILIQNLIT